MKNDTEAKVLEQHPHFDQQLDITLESVPIVALTQGEVLDELKNVAALYAGEGQSRLALEYYTQSLGRKG